ncbi:MAG TPA: hypothetical protein VMT11_00795 [Myxococcaceae bacterium]|nr:hypothetical protein [Myxococcaceae bacterium]
MSRNARIALVSSLLILAVLVAATLMAEPLVHPCPSAVEQCGRICAGQTLGTLPWRCERVTRCDCPRPLPWPHRLHSH